MKKGHRILTHLMAAILGSVLTLGAVILLLPEEGFSKLDQLSDLIEDRFIGDADRTRMEDAAAEAMVASLGDRWSYYISAAEFDSYLEQMDNAYVGVGITISIREDGYLDIMQVTETAPAALAGLLPGDILRQVDGVDCAEAGMEEVRNMVRGPEGSTVELTVERSGEMLDFTVNREKFQVPVVEYQMLEDQIGYIHIFNFDSRCAEETIGAISELQAQGARALLFDVRNNPGGYKDELCQVLDYLLPEGVLFRSEYYDGTTEQDESGPDCVELPMAVLVNGESYSAAEFFAAALREYEAGPIIGEKTVGKGYFQQTYELLDHSAVGLSVGRYFTPKGESLAETGLVPDVEVPVDLDTFAEIYYGTLDPMEDPQVLAALNVLK